MATNRQYKHSAIFFAISAVTAFMLIMFQCATAHGQQSLQWMYADPVPEKTIIIDPIPASGFYAISENRFRMRPPVVQRGYAVRVLAGCAAMFVAGCSNGLNETISFHYDAFKKHLPNANDQFWDGNKSWTNKYKNGDPAQGAKFKGSTGAFVWTTDGYHLTNAMRTGFFLGGTVTLGAGKARPTWQRFAEAGAGLLAYWAGSNLVYNVIFD